MTICIAAICESGEQIVTASDHMVSCGDDVFDDVALKIEPIHPNWHALIAGDVSSWATPTLEGARQKLIQPRIDPISRGLLEVVKAIRESFLTELNARALESALAPLFESVSDFRKNGEKVLGKKKFHERMERIERIKKECALLVTGFDPDGEAHIFAFEGKRPEGGYYNGVAFWAIGSGKGKALESLLAHSYNVTKKLPEAIYRVLQAKFSAETVKGVGRKTFLCVAGNKPASRLYILPHNIEKIRMAWETDHRTLPVGIIAEILNMLVHSPRLEQTPK